LQAKKEVTRAITLDVSLPVYELREGMFVSNVDCGWRNTPFLLEGLLITSEDQIATLKSLTDYVTVDPMRSVDLALTAYLEKAFGSGRYGLGYDDAETLAGLTAIGTPDKLSPTAATASHDDELEALTRQAKSAQKKHSWWRRFGPHLQFWRRFNGGATPASGKARPDYIPAHIELVSYPDAEFSWPAVPVAVTACKSALSLLSGVAQGIASRSVTDLRTLERAAQTMAEHMIAHPDAIMWAAKMLERDNALYQRSLEVGIYLTIFGRHLGLSRELLADLAMIGFLLDMGKTAVSPHLLNKQGVLSSTEKQHMQQHVNHALHMISQVGSLPDTVLCAIAEHHERVDGNGYPNGLWEPDISLLGKMAAIVDSYVAMVNPRAYAKTFAPHTAIKELFAGAGSHWHEPLIEQFVQAIGVFPVGSLVEMTSGHVAIVIQHTPIRRLEPKILIVTRRDKKLRAAPLQLDMLRHNARQKEARLQILKGLPDGSYGIDVRNFYFGSR
jgi:HD-GYP domain-containing protein (c-di-GMP phosphodiesterase class II)